MFGGCRSLLSLDLTNFVTSNVIDMGAMFRDCSKLKEINVSHFDTSNVRDMQDMFEGCSELNSLDLGNFDTSNAYVMSHMFDGCINLRSLNISSFNTSKVSDMTWMFKDCKSLKDIDVSHFDTSSVYDEDTEQGHDYFTGLEGMFYNCASLTQIDLSGFKIVKNLKTSQMFYGCSNLKTIYCGNKWNIDKVWESTEMFANCANLVGGKGTTYDSEHTDIEYARIDGGPNSPGYFTDINAEYIEAIDLGLPSGTLWASCNVGATKPEEVGGYYAWGETEEKAEYTKDTYLYWSNQFNGGDDIGENICGTNYDVAHVKWSQGWQMPDLDQIKELLENCSHEVVEQNNVKGMKFTGTNGNSIFLPITGLYIGNKVYGKDDYCVYWTGIPPTPLGTAVYYLYVDGKGETHWDYLPENRYYRYYGMPIRPVINSKLAGPGTDTIGGGDEV